MTKVTSNLPAVEFLRSAAVTFRLLNSSSESFSFPKINKVISRALEEAGDQEAIVNHKAWVDAHNKKLTKVPIRRLAELHHYETKGLFEAAATLPPFEAPETVIRRYFYGGNIHVDEARLAEIPDEMDEFAHPHGLIGFLQDMDQLAMFYLGYGELVSKVSGISRDGR